MKTTFRVSWQINVRESHSVPAIYTAAAYISLGISSQPFVFAATYNQFCVMTTSFSTPSRAGHDRLTCPAQPGHGGKRRDSPEGRVSSVMTKFIQGIDHEPTYLNETQQSNITLGTLEWLGAPMKCLAKDG